jgi:hypothetical protein
LVIVPQRAEQLHLLRDRLLGEQLQFLLEEWAHVAKKFSEGMVAG